VAAAFEDDGDWLAAAPIWIFPECARTLALLGADIICHPANLVLPYCQDAMVVRCLENRVFAITANRTGEESRKSSEPLRFTGHSQIVSPRGDRLLRASDDGETLETIDINPVEATDKRVTVRNDLFEDRRPELYGKLYKA
ncbi:nitrilase-related carbon-nitrogen hydrolase, partial [Thermodesulfobacteriota bacterium]